MKLELGRRIRRSWLRSSGWRRSATGVELIVGVAAGEPALRPAAARRFSAGVTTEAAPRRRGRARTGRGRRGGRSSSWATLGVRRVSSTGSDVAAAARARRPPSRTWGRARAQLARRPRDQPAARDAGRAALGLDARLVHGRHDGAPIDPTSRTNWPAHESQSVDRAAALLKAVANRPRQPAHRRRARGAVRAQPQHRIGVCLATPRQPGARRARTRRPQALTSVGYADLPESPPAGRPRCRSSAVRTRRSEAGSRTRDRGEDRCKPLPRREALRPRLRAPGGGRRRSMSPKTGSAALSRCMPRRPGERRFLAWLPEDERKAARAGRGSSASPTRRSPSGSRLEGGARRRFGATATALCIGELEEDRLLRACPSPIPQRGAVRPIAIVRPSWGPAAPACRGGNRLPALSARAKARQAAGRDQVHCSSDVAQAASLRGRSSPSARGPFVFRDVPIHEDEAGEGIAAAKIRRSALGRFAPQRERRNEKKAPTAKFPEPVGRRSATARPGRAAGRAGRNRSPDQHPRRRGPVRPTNATNVRQRGRPSENPAVQPQVEREAEEKLKPWRRGPARPRRAAAFRPFRGGSTSGIDANRWRRTV